MQTFLPVPSFTLSAQMLDYKRLGKQRLECKQLLNALAGGKAWRSHPAARMWANNSAALANYGVAICTEWRRRGYKDEQLPFFQALANPDADNPAWLGDDRFHAAHRSNLLRKAPEFYGRYDWSEPNDLPYVWPV